MIPQPRAHKLVGKHARMAILAATLPTPVLDVLRSRQAPPVPPRSRVPTPPAAQAAGGRTGKAELGEGLSMKGLRNPSRTAVRVVLRAHACTPVTVSEQRGCDGSSIH